MPSADPHRIHRHPAAPWVELRVSVNTPHCYQPHSHAEYSLGIVDDGQAVFHHPDGPHQVQTGSVVLIEPDVVHACNPGDAHPWSYRMMFIDAQWLHREVARRWVLDAKLVAERGLEFPCRRLDDPAVRRVADRLCRPLSTEADVTRLAEDLPAWLAGLARLRWSEERVAGPEALAPAITLLQTRPDERHTVRALAEACGLSPTRFIRHFQAAHGLTPGRWLQNQRVNGARRLMAQGVSLAEAAHAMGFTDQAHMHRAFKARHAMTPGRYQAVTE